MGNYDDAVANRRLVCGCDYKDEKAMAAGVKSITWTIENTQEASLEFLGGLPAKIIKEINGYSFLFVHGSPLKLNEYLFEDMPATYINSMFQEANVDVIICGHTHLPYHRVLEYRHIINAGSAGKPKHGDPQAVYALIETGDYLRVDFVKIQYDYEAAARAEVTAGLPAEFVSILRTGVN